jgi:hypothetical protein
MLDPSKGSGEGVSLVTCSPPVSVALKENIKGPSNSHVEAV